MESVVVFEVEGDELIEATDLCFIPDEGDTVRLNDVSYEVASVTWMLNPQRYGAYKFYPLIELVSLED